ncbi:aspartate aminotransferase family protein [Candidatus Bathyarchaeota archaeon]|nr:aspartate aminotransferase family protein [Candidatus Bathyarchaeota archaeon]
MESKTLEILQRDAKVIAKSMYIRFYPMAIEEGEGVIVRDADGKEYLDFLGGWSVAGTGHRHPKVMQALRKEIDKLLFNSFISFSNETTVRLAEKLVQITPGDFPKKVWFGLTGSDANDCVFKLVPYFKKRSRFLSFVNSYHGQTMGSLSLSGHKSQSAFVGFSNVVKVPYPYCFRCPFKQEYPTCDIYCIDYIEDYVFKTYCPPEDISGLIIEPIQSDGGDVVPPEGYMDKLVKLCKKYDITFCADEVKVGLGRTGKMFAVEHWNVIPELITLGKPIASGMPLSACVGKSEILDSKTGSHLFTLSGHPLSCAAALATIDVIENEGLVKNAEKMGKILKKRLEELKEKYEIIGDVRGKGLILGVEFIKKPETLEPAPREVAKICYRAWQLGLILGYVGMFSNVIEITPPLTINQKHVDLACEIFEQAIKDVNAGKVSDADIEVYSGW